MLSVLVPSWLSAVRGIFVMMIVVLGLANVANFVSQCTMQPQTRHFSACGFGFAGYCVCSLVLSLNFILAFSLATN